MKTLLTLTLLGAALSYGQARVAVGATVGYNDQYPSTGRYSDHDSTYATWCADNNTYVSAADGMGPQATFGVSGRNIFIWSLSDDRLTATVRNGFASYGTIAQTNTNGWNDNGEWKIGGLDCQDGVMYAWPYRQNFPITGPLYGQNPSLLKSLDYGLTWVNQTHVNHTTGAATITPLANGDPPGNNEYMFPASTGIMTLYPMQYAKDGVGVPAVDNNTTYKYFFADSRDLLSIYLMRVLLADYPKADPSLYEYWTGSGWSSSASAKTVLMAGCNSSPMYIAALKSYIAVVTSITDPVISNSSVYTAPSITGPWTLAYAIPTVPSVAQIFFSGLLKSQTTVGSSVTMYYISTGGSQNRTSDPNTNKYAPQFNLFTMAGWQSTIGGLSTVGGLSSIH